MALLAQEGVVLSAQEGVVLSAQEDVVLFASSRQRINYSIFSGAGFL